MGGVFTHRMGVFGAGGFPAGVALVGYQSYTVGDSGTQAFNLNSLTGGDGSPATIKAGDLILCCFGSAHSNDFGNPFSENPGFYPLITQQQSTTGGAPATTYLATIYGMYVLADGAVSGTFAARPANMTAGAVFYVIRGLHPRINAAIGTSFGIGTSVDPAAVSPDTFPSLAVLFAGGVSAGGALTFSSTGDATDVVQVSRDGAVRDVLVGTGLKRGITSAPYDPTAWTASASLSRSAALVAAFKEAVPTSAEFGKVPLLLSGGASAGGASGMYGMINIAPDGTATTSSTQLQGTNSIAFSGANDLGIGKGSGGQFSHPIIIMRDHDWTLDFMVRFNSITGDQTFVRSADTAGQLMFSLLRLSGKLEFYPSYNGTAFGTPIGATWTPSTGVNYHVRAVCDYPTLRIFVGTEGGTASLHSSGTLTGAIFQGTSSTMFGRVEGGGAALNGNMAEIRFLREAANTSDSSYTAPSTPWPRT